MLMLLFTPLRLWCCVLPIDAPEPLPSVRRLRHDETLFMLPSRRIACPPCAPVPPTSDQPFSGASEKAATAIADFVVLDMFANYATGREDVKGAIAIADRQLKRIYR